MSMKFWRYFSYAFIGFGVIMIIIGIVTQAGDNDGGTGTGIPAAGDIAGQTFIMIGAIFIAVSLLNLLIYRFFRPLTDASDNMMRAQGYKPGFAGTMQMASNNMAQATAFMANMNAGPAMANQLAASGIDGTATVTGSTDTGQKSNLNPVYALDLTVVAGTLNVELTHTTEVNTLRVQQVAVGSRLPVRVNPADPTQMLIQWEKVPV
jgi:hypothetical protein